MLKKYLLLFGFIIVNVGCSSSDSSDSSSTKSSISFTPTIYKDGIVKAIASNLMIHIGENAFDHAFLFDQAGNVASTQPAFTWTADSDAVTIDDTGYISANELGNYRILVSDGVHPECVVNLSVVADDVAIPEGPANAIFQKQAIVVDTNSSITIPNCILSDYRGNTIQQEPSFSIDNPSYGTIINNSTLNTTQNSGFAYISVSVFNGVSGELIPVFIPVFVGQNIDDSVIRYSVISFPAVFRADIGTISSPILLDVVEFTRSTSGGIKTSFYQTTPDFLETDRNDVFELSQNATIKTKKLGQGQIIVGYKNQKMLFNCRSCFDVAGSWVDESDGTIYDLERRYNAPDIFYTGSGSIKSSPFNIVPFLYEGYPSGLDYLNANVLINNQGQTTDFNTSSFIVPPIVDPNDTNNMYSIGGLTSGNKGVNFYWINKLNRLKVVNRYLNSTSTFISYVVRNGESEGNDPIDPVLTQILHGGSQRTWTPNDCIANLAPEIYTFKSDGSWTIQNIGGNVGNANGLHWEVSPDVDSNGNITNHGAVLMFIQANPSPDDGGDYGISYHNYTNSSIQVNGGVFCIGLLTSN